eukprot:scaffold2261_cov231-Pinguiococcus_pyrenoidosus.AAC.5
MTASKEVGCGRPDPEGCRTCVTAWPWSGDRTEGLLIGFVRVRRSPSSPSEAFPRSAGFVSTSTAGKSSTSELPVEMDSNERLTMLSSADGRVSWLLCRHPSPPVTPAGSSALRGADRSATALMSNVPLPGDSQTRSGSRPAKTDDTSTASPGRSAPLASGIAKPGFFSALSIASEQLLSQLVSQLGSQDQQKDPRRHQR